MSIDWRAADQTRTVQGKRAALATVDAQIADVEHDLEMARSFEGEFAARIASAERRVAEVSTAIALDGTLMRRGDEAERSRTTAESSASRRERDDQIAARTITSRDQLGRELRYCPLRTHDVSKRLGHLRAVRGRIERELADLEGRMSPGQIVQSGVPAAEYEERRQRVAALRERIGAT
jgi:hypothetical protein